MSSKFRDKKSGSAMRGSGGHPRHPQQDNRMQKSSPYSRDERPRIMSENVVPPADIVAGSVLHLNELKEMRISELTQLAKKFNIESAAGMRTQDLIFTLLQVHTSSGGVAFGDGVLERSEEGRVGKEGR